MNSDYYNFIENCYLQNKKQNRDFSEYTFSNLKENSKINIVIGYRNRRDHLLTTIKYINSAIKETNIPINLFIIEQDDKPTIKDICNINNINYAFLDIQKTSKYNQYSRALVFNSAIKNIIEPEWWLFHDTDLIVPNNFFSILEEKIKNCKTWIQPFAEKRVMFLSENDTKFIQNNTILDINEFLPRVEKPLTGAPGGSTLVPHRLCMEVGGYDDELFYGYAPEDAIFWLKLECLFGKYDHVNTCHLGNALYCDEIYQYHQYHAPSYNSNPLLNYMNNIRNIYYTLTYEQKIKLINLKKQIFQEK